MLGATRWQKPRVTFSKSQEGEEEPRAPQKEGEGVRMGLEGSRGPKLVLFFVLFFSCAQFGGNDLERMER